MSPYLSQKKFYTTALLNLIYTQYLHPYLFVFHNLYCIISILILFSIVDNLCECQ